MTPKLTISIIGPGRLGGTLACVASAAGYDIGTLGVRGESPAACELADALGTKLLPPQEAAMQADAVFLCCGDDAIEPLCQAIAQTGGFRNGQFVIHCSGAFESEILSAARNCGCHIGSFHPLQTFPDIQAGLARWRGTHCFVETASPQTREFLHELANATGAVPDDIEPGRKALYHAACVMCCNHMTALEDVALRVFEQAGISYDDALKAAAPILRATLENIISKRPAGALTGPVARGDAATVEKHLNALADSPEAADVYRTLCKAAINLAGRGGMISDEKIAILNRLLTHDEKEKN